MISPINNVNFKGVYTLKKAHVTKAQESVIEDIKLELNKNNVKKNFVADPIDGDKIKLARAYDLEEKGYGLDKKITYSTLEHIGTYNKECPFKIEDYHNFLKDGLEDVSKSIGIGLIGLGMLFSGIFLAAQCKVSVKPIEKEVPTLVKDSLNLLKK